MSKMTEQLLDLVAEVGYRLSANGAETFRVEESARRIMQAYGLHAEVFAIPSSLFVSLHTEDGRTSTRMRRIEESATDMDAVERYSDLSRRICSQVPDMETAEQWLRQVGLCCTHYTMALVWLGHFLAAAGFCMIFGGNLWDSLISGLCGIIAGAVNRSLHKRGANLFYRTILASFLFSLPAYLLCAMGPVANSNVVVIGALMPLVPGLLFTNAMRDITCGDVLSAVVRIMQVFLVAMAIALGTAVAWNTVALTLGTGLPAAQRQYPLWVQLAACFGACVGFALIFNIHGKGFWLCALGGVLTWLIYALLVDHGYGDTVGYFWGSVFAAVYAELMARLRKYPAISYLVISLVPLIPGSGLYYTMHYAVNGNVDGFAGRGMNTIVLAGIMAVGIIMVNTTVRLWHYGKKSAAAKQRQKV